MSTQTPRPRLKRFWRRFWIVVLVAYSALLIVACFVQGALIFWTMFPLVIGLAVAMLLFLLIRIGDLINLWRRP